MENKKILECSSKGDTRFSAYFARVEMFGVLDSIENHYQKSKVFWLNNGTAYQIKDTKEVKGKNKRKDLGDIIGVSVNGMLLQPKYLTPLYNCLWIKYLDENEHLVEYAKEFEDFSDMFNHGNSINCQADTIRQYIKQGRASFFKDETMKEFLKFLK